MKILLTNDDGVFSEGLGAVRKGLLDAGHDVWTVAPSREMSGTSHSITLKEAVRLKKVDHQVFSCSGTPADCVLFSYLGAIPIKPDIVVSGINHGSNLGTDVIYSGTAAAARQAALMGYPGIAVSNSSFYPPFYFDNGVRFIVKYIEGIKERWSSDHFLNVNFPNVEDEISRVVMTFPSRRVYTDHLTSFKSPKGEIYYFLDGNPVETSKEDGSDWDVVSKGGISVSPIYLHPIDHHEKELYNGLL